MNTRFSCRLNGVELGDIDRDVYITDISEDAPRLKTVTAANAGYDGLRVTSVLRQSLTVTVSFALRVTDAHKRARVMDEIAAWARPGCLEVGYRPNQRLIVRPSALPSLTSALNWTGTMQVVLTAYELPFWQSALPVSVRIAGPAASGEAVLTPPGTAESCFLETEVTPAAPMDACTLQAGSTRFLFSGLGMAAGETLKAVYDDSGLLRLTAGSRSVLDKRLPGSDDDLILAQRRANPVSFTADAPCAVLFRARGRYL